MTRRDGQGPGGDPAGSGDRASPSCASCRWSRSAATRASREPRSTPTSIKTLAASIADAGVVQPLIVRPLARRSLRADRRRAPLAGGSGGRPGDGARDRPRRGRARAPADGADREHGARGPQPGRRGARLRGAGRGSGALQGGAGAAAGPQPPGDLEPDPPPRPSRRGARPARRGELSEGHGRAILQARGQRGPPRARPRGRGTRLVGPRDRAPGQGGRAGKPRPKVVPHPDQEAALVRAEEALESALGHRRARPPRSPRHPRGAPLRRPGRAPGLRPERGPGG